MDNNLTKLCLDR